MCYCGPFWLGKRFRCLLSKGFNEDCREHDENYENQELSRAQADIVFQRNMYQRAERMEYPKLRKAQAWLYYRLVRIGGGISYGKKD